MRAAMLHRYGPPEVFTVDEVPEPTVERPGDVRIAVRAAAVNPIDLKIRAGLQRGAIRLKLPWTLGLDVAGEVVEVGSAVSRFAVGDAVMGCPDWRRPGSYAQQVVVDEHNLVHKPESLSWAEGAGLPLVGLTAWQCLVPRLGQRAGQRVLIQAGAGGVGHVAIQLAKAHGAWVAATCSPSSADRVRALGADRTVDYRTERWWEVLDDLDVILDSLGGEERERALQAVNRGGRVVSIVSGLPTNTERYGPNLGVLATAAGMASFWLRGRLRGVDAVTVVKRNDHEQLQALVDLADRGAVEVGIDRCYALDELPAAHRHVAEGHTRGKVVIEVPP